MTIAAPDRFCLTDDLEISRVLNGLWQVADMERGGVELDPESAADDLARYAGSGFDTFDMADHYGSAEIIASRLLRRCPEARVLTKWCPPPGSMTPETVRDGVQERLDRLGVDRLDLLQFHWWSFEHPAWLDALHEFAALRADGLIGEIGVTNFDAAHLHLALADGVPVRTNQMVCSLLDRRFTEGLAETCARHGVHLLAYGTICGGFLSEQWLGQPEPTDIADWSKMKYRRFIETAGGWDAYQAVLSAAAGIARKHRVSAANVAARWVLDHPHVAGVIIGVRPGMNDHRTDNARIFEFDLDLEDHEALSAAFARTSPIPGDCGDEYRTPPFLTASGDLSHHLISVPPACRTRGMRGRSDVRLAMTGSKWETLAGYCRARRIGDRILVSGTTATAGTDRVVAEGDAGAQATYILDKIIGAVGALGGSVEDICRTRIYLTDINDTETVCAAHGRVFGELMPANTLIGVEALAGDYLVEIEAEAITAES